MPKTFDPDIRSAVLDTLIAHSDEHLTANALATLSGVTYKTVLRHVEALRKEGLVQRRRTKNKRGCEYKIKAKVLRAEQQEGVAADEPDAPVENDCAASTPILERPAARRPVEVVPVGTVMSDGTVVVEGHQFLDLLSNASMGTTLFESLIGALFVSSLGAGAASAEEPADA